MFTGIVEEVGKVKQIRRGEQWAKLTIGAAKILEDTKIGDSISVNGVCLTVTDLSSTGFSADVMHETLRRSCLTKLKQGGSVNLERAMSADGRYGGHMVAGHVDGVGKITGIRRDNIAVLYRIQAEPPVMRYIVKKGSVAVDGISLTVAEVFSDGFTVSAIPHTVSQTILRERSEGDLVNLETDIIAKYVEKLMYPVGPERRQQTITKEFLSQYGF